MPERKEPPYLLLFLLLSLLLHLSLAYRLRDWQPLSRVMQALTEKKKEQIPVQIIELPKKKPEPPQAPPEKPSFLADRNRQSPEDTRRRESLPARPLRPAAEKQPVPPPPPAADTQAPPETKAETETQSKPRPETPAVPEKAKPEVSDEALVKPEPKPEPRPEVKAETTPEPKAAASERPPAPSPLKKLFPSFEELTRQTETTPRPEAEAEPRLPEQVKEGTELSLNTLDYKFHSYYLALKRKIELVWEYPLQARMNGLQGRLLMRFVINRDGSLAEVKVLQSSGVAYLDYEAVRAVRAAAPFPPLPERMRTKTLSVTATFEYLLGYRSVR